MHYILYLNYVGNRDPSYQQRLKLSTVHLSLWRGRSKDVVNTPHFRQHHSQAQCVSNGEKPYPKLETNVMHSNKYV